MINKNLMLAGAVVLLIGIAGSFFYFKNNKSTAPSVSPTPAATIAPTTEPSSSPSASPSVNASPSGTVMEQNVINLTSTGFEPQTLTVKAGAKVTWKNTSGATATVNSDPHPIHTLWPFLNLGSFQNGASLSVVFDKPGTYTYHNHLNSSQKGTVIVK